MADRPLPPARRGHLGVLAGPFGIWQHAAGAVPDQAFGSCTDDVARALTVDLLHRRELGWDVVGPDAARSLRFLGEAFDPATGSFRNFRAADGAWLDGVASQDSQGRALLALGGALAAEDGIGSAAGSLFLAAVPHARRLTALRAISSAVLACDQALSVGADAATSRTFEHLVRRLRAAFSAIDLNCAWPWPEPVLTYENALLPRALIAAGMRLGDPELRRWGLRVLDWLLAIQVGPGGAFRPIGSEGWWPRGGTAAVFDQQPIDATATILAAEAAFDATGEQRYRRAAERAYAWFLGDNDLGVVVAVPRTGGCHDGISPRGVNRNQGAESTLMWLTALEHIRTMRATVATPDARLRRRVGTATRAGVTPHPSDELFWRHPANPIITVDHLPYRANSVFNPGVGRVGDDVVLLVRVEDLRGISHLLVARSLDGATAWRFDAAPLLAPESEHHPEEVWGCEDPRLTWLPERDEWAIAYTAYSRRGPLVSLAMSRDFTEVRRFGPVMPPEDKDAALFPRRIGNRWAMVHRPSPLRGLAHMWISYSPDLRHWGDHELLLEAHEGAWWDAGKIGLGPPPLETSEGWLICYHGVHSTAAGPHYRVGLALLDLDDPRIVLRRTEEWVFGPAAPYERSGDINKVVFPTGWLYDAESDALSLYYGAGDSVIGLATASLREVLAHLLAAPARRSA